MEELRLRQKVPVNLIDLHDRLWLKMDMGQGSREQSFALTQPQTARIFNFPTR